MAEGAVISKLVDLLTEFLRDGVSPIWRVREQVEPLRVELKAIHCFLKDMDGKEGKEASVKNWLASVRDAAYEAEDLIEEFMVEGQNHAPFRAAMVYNSYAQRIDATKSKISQLVELRKRYLSNLPNSSAGQSGTSSNVDSTWRRTSYFLNDDTIVGFEQHKYHLMQMLLSPDPKLQTIVITGMGGSGKTTLASMLYNEAHKVWDSYMDQYSHPKEPSSHITRQKHFGFLAWVTVGVDPDIPTLLRIILAQENCQISKPSKYEFINPDQVITLLRSSLLQFLRHWRHKYLIVLDDVWTLDVYSQLMQALPDTDNGNRIIVTSRQRDFPSSVSTSLFVYELKPINDEESWKLFLNKAFPQSNLQMGSCCPKELEGLGRELSKKCYGLPLALVILGGLVSRKSKHPAVWIELLESLNWVSTKDGQECLYILSLSYNDLPYHVKPCFLYLGAYKPDSEISTSKLIKVWAGDGLVSEREGRTNEEVCFEYLDELIQRCMVQVAIRAPDNRVKRIRIHGLLSELALSEAKESRFLHVLREYSEKMFVFGTFHRRLALHCNMIDFLVSSSNKLRAVLAFPKNEACKKIVVGGLVKKLRPFHYRLAELIPGFKLFISQPKTMMYIRVLELEGVHFKGDIFELPEGNMLHLRYLGLRNTKLKKFPFMKSSLQYLQTLDIRGTSIYRLPDQLWTSKTLEHLYLNSRHQSPRINNFPRGLQTLVGLSGSEWLVSELSSLTALRYLKMELPDFSSDEIVNPVGHLSNLMSLKLRGKNIPRGVIEVTRNHRRFFKLNLQGALQPNVLPAFEGFACYLTELTLSGSRLEQDPMSTLKQLGSLRVLKLKDYAYLGGEIVCSSGGFCQLQHLKLSGLHFASFRVEPSALPSLARLSIHGCSIRSPLIPALEQVTTLQVLKLKTVLFAGNQTDKIKDFCHGNNVLLKWSPGTPILPGSVSVTQFVK